MARVAGNRKVIHEFLGSTHIFASAVRDVVEKGLLKDVTGGRLTHSQFVLLKMVAMADARTISDVARFLGVTKAAASKAVDKLVRLKLLLRAEGTADRREMSLSLTEASQRLLAAYEARKERKLAEIFRDYPADALLRTANLLDRLSAGLVNHHAKPDEVCLQCGIYFRDRCLVRQLVNRRCFYLRHRSRAARSSKESGPERPAGASGSVVP